MREHVKQSSRRQCTQCGKILATKAALVIHTASHAYESHKLPVQCELCGRIYKNPGNLEQHKKHIHSDDNMEYECNTCGLRFQRRLHLIRHLSRNHVKCPECQKMFERKMSMTRHFKYVHGHVKNHKCDICDKAFTRRDTLVAHSRVHTGEKPFKCSQCDMRFGHSGTLYTHVRSIHLKIKQRRGNNALKRSAAAVTTAALLSQSQPQSLVHLEYC